MTITAECFRNKGQLKKWGSPARARPILARITSGNVAVVVLLGFIGAPQIAALLVLCQRGLEELYSARNTKALLAKGASEAGNIFFPVVAATHLAWIAALAFLIPPDAPVTWPLIVYYLALQLVRYWVIADLGPYWTHALSRCPTRR